ncbi:MAG: DUF5667 domain-containing protein [Parcubacteria group bacterium]|nr:DUF5667 domain-containing protein [Parcubacteria group bacterium]MCR4342337.1 DUF5667 domain-containing protein [Patescibacteria group bacterium]
MIKKIRIIRELKRLRRKPVDKIFLNSLKTRLEVLVNTCPGADERKALNPIHETLKSIFGLRVTQVSIAVFMIIVLLGTSVATASQGSLPGEKLYLVKIFTEEVRSVVALKNKEKAKLSMGFAEKRINEIKEVLEKTEIESEDLEIALSQLEKNLTRVTDIIEAEKSLTVKLEEETTNINQDINRNKETLEKILKEKRVKTENKQKELEKNIKKTIREESAAKETLIDELVEVRINKEILERLETKKREETKEIKESENKYNLEEEESNKGSGYSIKNKEDKRGVIKSREESRKEIREKVMKEIYENEDKSEDQESNRGDEDRD